MISSSALLVMYQHYLFTQPSYNWRGAVLTNKPKLKKIIESLRVGTRLLLPSGQTIHAKKDLIGNLGASSGYDHKYIYSHIGYNLKATDMQAAIGVTA